MILSVTFIYEATGHDVVVEDLLWNSLEGNALKQQGKDRSLEDVLPQNGHIGRMRVQLSTSIHPLSEA
jgi:hypothetical protein